MKMKIVKEGDVIRVVPDKESDGQLLHEDTSM